MKRIQDSVIVDSCSLDNRWEWLAIGRYGDATTFTSEPRHDETYFRSWHADKGMREMYKEWMFRIPQFQHLPVEERLWHREGDKWVHVGGAK